MFICDKCLSKYYENDQSWVNSYGACEICKQVKKCNDIPSKYLVVRKDGEKC